MIYLDNAATSWPKPAGVIDAMVRFMTDCGANPGRGGYRSSLQAASIVFETRAAIANLVGADSPLHVVFTKNATEALNIVIWGTLSEGGHVITTEADHNAVLRPLRYLQHYSGVSVTCLPPVAAGAINAEQVAAALKPNTRLIVVCHASNVVGSINPIASIAAVARKHNILFCVDAAQSAGCVPIDCNTMGIDCLAMSGHKGLYGPQGTGILVMNNNASNRLSPHTLGGTASASSSDVHPDFMPDKFEAGTVNTVGIAGLLQGVKYVMKQTVASIFQKQQALRSRLVKGLYGFDNIRVTGYDTGRENHPAVGVVSFTMEGTSCEQLATELERQAAIVCRAGLHCAPLIHRHFGTFPEGALRVSTGTFTTESEIDTLLDCLRTIRSQI